MLEKGRAVYMPVQPRHLTDDMRLACLTLERVLLAAVGVVSLLVTGVSAVALDVPVQILVSAFMFKLAAWGETLRLVLSHHGLVHGL